MNATCYLRIAKTNRGYVYAATSKPSLAPLTDQRGDAYPTRQIRLNLQLPKGMFDLIEATVEVEVPEEMANVVAMPQAQDGGS